MTLATRWENEGKEAAVTNGAFEFKMNIIDMIVLIVFIIILAVFVLIILKNMIAASRKIYKKIFKEERKPKGKAIRRWIVNFTARVVAMAVIGAIIISGCKSIYTWRQISAMMNEEEETGAAASQKYLAVLSNIPFRDEVLNEEETLWENLLNEGLMYNEYLARADSSGGFAGLRSCYQGNSMHIVEWPEIDIDKLVKQVEKVYGSELLPITEADFKEVNAIIDSYDDPLMVPAKVYKAEFWVRISMGKDGFSAEALYQIGRAADDVLKVLYNSGKITVKEWIFFGSMAVSFYLASIEHDNGLRDLPFTFYRIAEIFIYLDKYSPLKNEEAYSRHFRLMAEKALGDAADAFDDTYEREKIREKIPYFYCYYAEILYEFSRLCPNGEEDLAEVCREHAGRCVMGDAEGEYCTTCGNLLEKLK